MKQQFTRRTVLKGSAALAAAGALALPAGGQAVLAAGGTLTYAQSLPITSADPANPQTYPASYEAVYTMFNNLVTFDPNLKIIPDLAEKWERSADNLTWTFHLRQGVTFHDGTPFNAQAVEAHIKRIQDPAIASPNANLWTHITGVKVVDDQTVQLVTAKPFAATLNYLAHGSGGIESPAAVNKYGKDFPTHPIGTGPYKLDSFSPGTQLTLGPNDAFYGEKPKLGKIVMQAVGEVGTRVSMLQASAADLANAVPPENAEQLAAGPTTQLLKQKGLQTFWLAMNLNREVFKDVRVRQALNYAVNKESIVKNLFLDYATVLDSPASPTIQGHSTAGSYPYNPDKAKQLLAEAGWKPNSSGILEKDGVPMKFTINTAEGQYPNDLQVVEAAQADLKHIGCDVTIWKVEAASRYDYIRLPKTQAKYDMYIFGFNPSNGDIGYHLNSNFRTNSDPNKAPDVWNDMWYSNPKVDNLLNQADQAVDQTKRFNLLGQAQALIWDDAPVIWLYVPDLLVAAAKDVSGVYIWPTVFVVVRNASKAS